MSVTSDTSPSIGFLGATLFTIYDNGSTDFFKSLNKTQRL